MPGAAHETIVSIIRSHPEWFDALLHARGQAGLPAGMTVADTAVRVVAPIEVRPDVLFVRGAKKGPWVVVEPQRDDDDGKQRRWLLAAAALFNERGVMGDVLVVTNSRTTAKWARRIAMVEGPMGTTLALVPVVVLLTRDVAEELLATGQPELALFAAWAVHHQRGVRALKVVRRAVDATERAKDPELRDIMIQAIVGMLDGELREKFRETMINLNKLPDGSFLRTVGLELEARGEARGKAHGKAEALLQMLTMRSFIVDENVRAHVLACTDLKTIETWIDRALTAKTIAEVLGDTAAPPRSEVSPARRKRTR